MATTVNSAFAEFMANVVNLDPDITSNARASRDNLLSNIAEFDNADDFFDLYDGYNVHFGSFARRTKCRELDDIDLMIGITGCGSTYNPYDPWNNVKITSSSTTDPMQLECTREDGTLNSTKVTNKFKKKLESVREYARSEIRRNGEAVILNLKSKDWSFDIVPCFHTVEESDGRSYYLIPNGDGHWQKTDPVKDKDKVTATNQKLKCRVLELIRICKKWNKVKNTTTIQSYMLETMIINYCDNKAELSQYFDLRFKDALNYIANNIMYSVYDLKEIQGDINTLSYSERLSLSKKAQDDYKKACNASTAEIDEKDHKKAIGIWGDILGSEFPKYE